MMRAKSFLIFLILSVTILNAVDLYFGADFVLPSPKETRGKNNPDYVSNEEFHPLADLKSKWESRDGRYESATPSYSALTLNARAGFYLSKRNRAGLEFLYTMAESDADFDNSDSLTASSFRTHDYSTLTAHFAQELWSGLFVDGKAGWAWRYTKWDNVMMAGDEIVEINSSGSQITGPAFGIGIGWNQKIFSKVSLVFHMNWINHFYIDDQIKRARIFTLNAGINWGMHYHNTKQGKN